MKRLKVEKQKTRQSKLAAGLSFHNSPTDLSAPRFLANTAFNMTFPEDYQAEHLAGQEVTFKTNLKELKARQVPAIDDEFAKDLGHDDLSALQSKYRVKTLSRAQSTSRRKKRRNSFLMPYRSKPVRPCPGDGRRPTQPNDAQCRSADAADVWWYEARRGRTSRFRENARPNAERQVRGGLLLVEVSKAAKIEVNDEDIDKEIAHILSQAGRNAAMLEARFKEPQERNNIRFKCIEDKTIQWVVDHAVRVEPKAEESAAD